MARNVRSGSIAMLAQSSTSHPSSIATENAPVWDILNRNLFFVKNAVKGSEAKTSDKLDVLDPESEKLLIESREPNLGAGTKIRRFLGAGYDISAPFDIHATDSEIGRLMLRVERKAQGFLSLSLPPVSFYDHNDTLIVQLQKRRFALGHKFRVLSPAGEMLFELCVKDILNGYKFMIGKEEIGRLSLTWKGSDFFKKGGFKFALSIHQDVPQNKFVRQMVMAFTLAFYRIMLRAERT